MSLLRLPALLASLAIAATTALAQVPNDAELKAFEGKVKDATRKGIKYLCDTRDPQAGWGHYGFDALALHAILNGPDTYDDSDPFVRIPLDGLLKAQAAEGCITQDGALDNYITSIAMMTWAHALAAGKLTDPERKKAVEAGLVKARDYLVRIQADEGEGYQKNDKMYGGVGYGGDMRPDLSNTHLALEAARAAGLPADDPFFQKAMVFLQRTQNRTESNDQKGWPGNDGGFVYYPGNTYAGTYKKEDGSEGLNSYGSMTYAGVKSYIYAGLTWEDPRVQAAMGWISKNYSVDTHPNMGKTALFYYYVTFARTMDLYSKETGSSILKDASGQEHHWRYDLAKQLLAIQNADGSWKNSDGKWMEGDPKLATMYSVLALNHCQKLAAPKKKDPPKDPPKEPARN